MTNEEMTLYVKTMTDETDETLISTYLSIAKQKILNYAFPYEEVTELPTKLHIKQCEIAAYLINKRGAEGEKEHSENGVTRKYGSADIPSVMLSDIKPKVGVIG